MAFNQRAFGKLSATLEGKNVKVLVSRKTIQADMIAAARLRRPSVEILDRDLVQLIPSIEKPGAGIREDCDTQTGTRSMATLRRCRGWPCHG